MSLQLERTLTCPQCQGAYHLKQYRTESRYVCVRCGVEVQGLEAAPDLRRNGALVHLYGARRSLSDAGNAAHLPTASTIGRYDLVQELGRGGMGVVYKAWDPELGRHVALKLLLGGGLAAQANVERFLREARAAARLDHPHIVRVHDIGRHEGQVYFTMDFIEGASVREVLDEVEHLPVPEALRITAAIARALHYAHMHGVVHRDVKPANLLLENDGAPYVTDFGLAKEVDAQAHITRSGQILGTPSYMPPEQASGGGVGPLADVYALGAVLYEMLCGKPPYDGETGIDVLVALMSAPPAPIRTYLELPRDVELILEKAMERSPDRRYTSALALAEDIDRYLAGDPIRARAPTLSYRASLFLKKHGRRTAEIAVTVAVGCALAWGWFAWRAHLAEREEAALEARASVRLGAVEQRIGELYAKGQHDEAEKAFRTFTSVEEHRATDAFTRAWLHRAVRMSALGRSEEEVASYATAYTAARRPDQQGYALLGLARAFRRSWRWDRVDLILDALQAQIPRTAVLPEVAAMRAEADLARRDTEGALQWMRRVATDDALERSIAPVVAALAGGTRLDEDATDAFVADLAGDDADDVLLVGQDGALITLGSGLQRTHHPMPAGLRWFPVDGGPGRPDRLLSWDPATREASLWEWADGAPRAVYRWTDDALTAATAADLDDDGDLEVYVGTGPWTRHLVALNETAAGWEATSPHPATDHAQSDVTGLLATDLDDDGAQELVVAAGAWRAYDVRVLEGDPPTTQARRRVGAVSGLATVRGRTGPRLVVAKVDRYPSRTAFPEHAPYGDPAGVYLYELGDAGLTLSGHLAAPRPTGEPLALEGLIAADLDGDGLDDLVANADAEPMGRTLLVYRQLENGSFARAALGGLTALAAVQADDDRASELVVRPDEGGTWILGLGQDALPLVAPAREAPPLLTVPVVTDPVLARSWHRAEELAAMGLVAEAADVLEDLGTLATGTALAPLARFRAADLRAHAGELARAAALYEDAAADPALAADALARASDAWQRDHRYDEALRLLDALLARRDVPVDERRDAEQRREWLDAAAHGKPLVLAFDQPLSERWRIAEPLSLRRGAGDRVLHVDAFSDQGVIAQVPLRWTGPFLGLSVDLSIDRTEWGSGLEIALEQAEDADGIALFTRAWGGGGLLEREIGCRFPGGEQASLRQPIDGPADGVALSATVAVAPDAREAWCEIRDADGAVLFRASRPLVHTPARDALRVTLRGLGEAGHPMWTASRLRRIAIRGGAWGTPAPETDTQRAARKLVDGNPTEALSALDGRGQPPPVAALWRVVAYEHLSMPKEGERVLAKALRSGDPAFDAGLGRLLRAKERELGPAVREVAGPRFFAIYGDAWLGAAANHRDDELVQRSLMALRGFDEAGTGGAGAEVRLALLAHRGRAWAWFGNTDQARVDLERAAAWADARRGSDPDALAELVAIHQDLCVLEVGAGRPKRGLEHARRAVALSPAPELVLDRLGLEPELAAYVEQPGWSELIRP